MNVFVDFLDMIRYGRELSPRRKPTRDARKFYRQVDPDPSVWMRRGVSSCTDSRCGGRCGR
jgi:hypothetical protein